MAKLTKHELDLLFGGMAIGFAVGGVGMYFVVQGQMKTKYEELADAEIQEVKAHYRAKEEELLDQQKKLAEQPKPSLDEIAKRIARERDIAEADAIIEAQQYVDGDAEEELEEVNAFTELPPWNYDREVAARTGAVPFIMHLEEYQQSECSHQITITYFEGDDVLVDESDEVISKKDEVVGMDNLTKFGHGSQDPNVLYVRNPKLDIEYEILRHKGHYAKEILGLEEESLEHSYQPRRRMRFDDES